MKAIGHLNENSTSIIQFNQNVYKVLKATEILVYLGKKTETLESNMVDGFGFLC